MSEPLALLLVKKAGKQEVQETRIAVLISITLWVGERVSQLVVLFLVFGT